MPDAYAHSKTPARARLFIQKKPYRMKMFRTLTAFVLVYGRCCCICIFLVIIKRFTKNENILCFIKKITFLNSFEICKTKTFSEKYFFK